MFAVCLGSFALSSCFLFDLLTPHPADHQQQVAESIRIEMEVMSLPPAGTTVANLHATISGGSGTATMTLGPLPPGVDAKLSAAKIKEDAFITFTADSLAQPGRFTFTLNAVDYGSSEQRVTSTTLYGEILKPFELEATSATAITLGVPQPITIFVYRDGIFQQPVTLSVLSDSLPPGTTATLGQNVVTSNSTTLQLTLPTNTRPARYSAFVVGKYGASLDTAAFSFDVNPQTLPQDITLSATPVGPSIAAGGTKTFDIALGRTAPGIGNIDLTVSGLPNGATASFNPASVPLGTNASQMIVTTTTAIADSTYQLTITATAGSLVKSTTVPLVVVTPANFSAAVAPSALTVARSSAGQVTATFQTTGTVGAITVDAFAVPTLPTGVTVVPGPVTVNGNTRSSVLTFAVASTASPGTYPIIVRGTAGTLVRTANVSLTIPAPPPGDLAIQLLTPNVSVPLGGTIQIPIRLTRINTAIGQLIELTNTAMTGGGNAWISPSSTTGDTATLYVVGGSIGPANVVVSAVFGANPATAVAAVNVNASTTPDFSVTPAPATLNLSPGASQPMAVIIGRTNNFSSAVSFQAIGDAPGNFNVTFSLNSTTGTGIGMTVQAASGITAGPHTITIRGTSGTTVREVTMTVIIGTGGTPYPYPYYPYGIKRPPLQ